MPINLFTAKAVADLFKALSAEEQIACLMQFDLTAEGLFYLLHNLSPQEQRHFSDMTFNMTVHLAFPWMIQHALAIVKEHPEATNEELYSLVNEATKESVEVYQEAHTELAEAQLKEKRDRKSAPETVKRNVEICDRRKADKRKWTLGKLAKQYHIARQTVVRILEQETKWRRLASSAVSAPVRLQQSPQQMSAELCAYCSALRTARQ